MSALELLDINILDERNLLKVQVLFKPEYVKRYGETPFYNYFKNSNLFEITIHILSNGINISLFEFTPRRVFIPDEDKNLTELDQKNTYAYDLLNDEEKKLFQGLGHSILCVMIKYGLDRKYYHLDTVINIQPTNLFYGDSLREEVPDISAEQATEDFRKLYLYYVKIGFEPTEKIDWSNPAYKSFPKITTRMRTIVRKFLFKCLYKFI